MSTKSDVTPQLEPVERLESRTYFALIFSFEAPDSAEPGSGISVSGAENLEGTKSANESVDFSLSGLPPHTGLHASFSAYVMSDPLAEDPDLSDKVFEFTLDGSGSGGTGTGSATGRQTFSGSEVLDAPGSFGAGGLFIDLVTSGTGTADIDLQVSGMLEGQTWVVHMVTVATTTTDIVWLTVSGNTGNEGSTITGTLHRVTMNTAASLVVSLVGEVPLGTVEDPAESSDYSIPSSVTIGANATQQTFSITLVQDHTGLGVEPSEEDFNVRITTGGSYEATADWHPTDKPVQRIVIADVPED